MTVNATNCHRAYAATAKPMGADFESAVIDFQDMPMGSIQVVWQGAQAPFTGVFTIYASNYPDPSSFDEEGCKIDCSELDVTKTAGSLLWIRDRLAFRYALVRYRSNLQVGGTADIIALGKKS